MSGIARASVDSAGGIITGPGISSVRINGKPCSVIGDSVAPHAPGVHIAAVMSSGSSTVFAGGVAVCRAGDLATCGHAATGSSNVFAN